MTDKLYGLYRASVVNAADPLQMHRLQVMVPAIASDPLPWAAACVPSVDSPTPQVGDTVWVMFEAGDREYPVWIGVLPGRTA